MPWRDRLGGDVTSKVVSPSTISVVSFLWVWANEAGLWLPGSKLIGAQSWPFPPGPGRVQGEGAQEGPGDDGGTVAPELETAT